MGSSERSGGAISSSMPSFEIRGAAGVPATPRWDRIDSRALIRAARGIYFSHLSESSGARDPLGVVLAPGQPGGRVVFELPALLPEEEFIELELIRGRNLRGRRRLKG